MLIFIFILIMIMIMIKACCMKYTVIESLNMNIWLHIKKLLIITESSSPWHTYTSCIPYSKTSSSTIRVHI